MTNKDSLNDAIKSELEKQAQRQTEEQEDLESVDPLKVYQELEKDYQEIEANIAKYEEDMLKDQKSIDEMLDKAEKDLEGSDAEASAKASAEDKEDDQFTLGLELRDNHIPDHTLDKLIKIFKKMQDGELVLDKETSTIFLTEILDFIDGMYDKFHNTLTHAQAEELAILGIRQAQIAEEEARLQRTKRDAENAVKFANEKAVKVAIKPLLQNFDMAFSRLPKDTNNPDFENFKTELGQFSKDFKDNLAKHGIKIYGEIGDKFSTELHDAIARYPAPTPDKLDTIAHVSSQGFELNGRVIIPASVVIFTDEF